MGKNSKRLDLIKHFQEKVEDVIIHSNLRRVLTDKENDLIYNTKYTKFNNLYAEVIVNYKILHSFKKFKNHDKIKKSYSSSI